MLKWSAIFARKKLKKRASAGAGTRTVCHVLRRAGAWKILMFSNSVRAGCPKMKGEVVFVFPTKMGTGAGAYLPKRWLGWRVRVEVVSRARKAAEKARMVVKKE